MEDTEKQTTDLKADKKRLKDEKNKLNRSEEHTSELQSL